MDWLFWVGIILANIGLFAFVIYVNKLTHKQELQKKKMDIIDKHFAELIKIQCPYCKTTYKGNVSKCPNCGSAAVSIEIPEMPE